MIEPRPGSYDGSVYAPSAVPPQPPAFQRGRPNQQAAHLRPHPARSQVVWLTVAEVAVELRVSKMTVYRLVHSGELSSSRIGHSFRIAAGALDEFVAGAS